MFFVDFQQLEMLCLNLSAHFFLSVLLYSMWKTHDSAREVRPFHFCFGRFHSCVVPHCCFAWVQFVLGSVGVCEGTLLCNLRPGFSWPGKPDKYQRECYICYQWSVLISLWEKWCQCMSSEQLLGPGSGTAVCMLVISPIITMPPTFLFQRR